MTKAAALRNTPRALLPATTAAHTTLQPMDAPITPHTVMMTGTVAPHPTLAISAVGATHISPLTEATLAPAASTTHHKILRPGR